jgi:hypothetical protein
VEVDPLRTAPAVKGLGFPSADTALETSEANAVAVVVGILCVAVDAFLTEEQSVGESLCSRANDTPRADIPDFGPQIRGTVYLELTGRTAAPPIDGLARRTEVGNVGIRA